MHHPFFIRATIRLCPLLLLVNTYQRSLRIRVYQNAPPILRTCHCTIVRAQSPRNKTTARLAPPETSQTHPLLAIPSPPPDRKSNHRVPVTGSLCVKSWAPPNWHRQLCHDRFAVRVIPQWYRCTVTIRIDSNYRPIPVAPFSFRVHACPCLVSTYIVEWHSNRAGRHHCGLVGLAQKATRRHWAPR